MPDLAELTLKIQSDQAAVAKRRLKELEQAGRGAETQSDRMTGSFDRTDRVSGKLAATLKRVALAVGATVTAMAGLRLAIKSIKLAGEFETTLLGFETLLGSAQAAKDMVQDLTDFAAKTPFEFTNLSKATRMMLAFGTAAEDILPRLQVIGDAAAAMGGDVQIMDSIVRSLGKIEAKTVVSGEEMNILTERGISGWQMLADAADVSTAEIMKMTEKRLITAVEGVAVMLWGMEEKYHGAMVRLSQSLPGLLSTLRDNVSIAMRNVGLTLVDALGIKDRLRELISFIQAIGPQISEVLKSFFGMADAMDDAHGSARLLGISLRTVLVTLIMLAAAEVLPYVIKGLRLLRVAMIQLTYAMAKNPFLLLAVAIAATITLMIEFRNVTVKIGDTTAGALDWVLAYWQVLGETAGVGIAALKNGIGVLLNTLIEALRFAFGAIGTSLGQTIDKWLSALQTMMDAVKWFANNAIAAFVTVWDSMKSLIAHIVSALSAISTLDPLKPWTFATTAANLRGVLADASADIAAEAGKAFSEDYVGAFIDGLTAKTKVVSLMLSDWTDALGLPDFGAALAGLGDLIANRAEALRLAREAGSTPLVLEDWVMPEMPTITVPGVNVAGGKSPMAEDLAEINDLLQQQESIARGVADALTDAFGDIVFAIKSAEDALNQFIEALIRLFFSKLVADPLSNMLLQLFQNLAGAIGGWMTPSTGGPSGYGGGMMGPVGLIAEGGIMTQHGLMDLQRYSFGGVANRPQLAIFGEGSTPEAYVPLPDGRRIPVAMKDGGRSVTVVNNVTIQSNTPDEFRRSERKVAATMSNAVRIAMGNA